MEIRNKTVCALFCLCGLAIAPVWATPSDEGEIASSSQSAKTKALETQVTELKQEVKSLKKQMHHGVLVHKKHTHRAKLRLGNNDEPTNVSGPELDEEPADDDYGSSNVMLQGKPLRGRDLIKLICEEKEHLPFDLDVPGQAFVSTGPYVGVPIQYSGSNLIVNSPSVNLDVQLLNIRKSIHKQLMAMGGEIFKEPYHSHLLLSGVVEGRADYFNRGGSPSTTNLNVTNVSLDAFFLGPSDWTLGFVEFSYDDNAPIRNNVFESTSYYTTSNSRVFVNKAFATVGDFSKSPFYGSFGQFYVPFGVYSSVMVSTPVTTLLTRTKARALLLGMQQQKDNGFYGSAYIFRGDSHAASVSKINNGGLNAGFKYKCPCSCGDLNGNFGAGLIANIADSGGMQIGNGFKNYEQISHRVPGYNLHGLFGIGEHIDLIGEFVGSTTAFSEKDMSFNGRGAKPWAFDTEAAYTFTILDERPSTIALSYQQTHEALSLGLPLSRISTAFTTSLLRNTLEGIEFRYDRTYAGSDTANGPTGAETVVGACTSATCKATGKSDKAIIASFDYYF